MSSFDAYTLAWAAQSTLPTKEKLAILSECKRATEAYRTIADGEGTVSARRASQKGNCPVQAKQEFERELDKVIAALRDQSREEELTEDFPDVRLTVQKAPVGESPPPKVPTH